MKITYSAPLAIPFCGENTALYGKPVVTAACSEKVTVSITAGKTAELDPFVSFINAEVQSYLEKKRSSYTKSSFVCSVSSGVKTVNSLSYKSAVIVAATAALLELYTGEKPEFELVNTLSYQIHKKFYKLSLGFFTSCSCFGGIQFYRKEFEFLKSVSKLNFKLALKIQNNLYTEFSNSAGSADESVEHIKKKYNAHAKEVESIFNEIEKNTKRIVVAIAQENEELFKTSFLKIQELDKQLTEKNLNRGIKLIYSSENNYATPFILSENGLERN
jgi:mevalonate kinase